MNHLDRVHIKHTAPEYLNMRPEEQIEFWRNLNTELGLEIQDEHFAKIPLVDEPSPADSVDESALLLCYSTGESHHSLLWSIELIRLLSVKARLKNGLKLTKNPEDLLPRKNISKRPEGFFWVRMLMQESKMQTARAVINWIESQEQYKLSVFETFQAFLMFPELWKLANGFTGPYLGIPGISTTGSGRNCFAYIKTNQFNDPRDFKEITIGHCGETDNLSSSRVCCQIIRDVT